MKKVMTGLKPCPELNKKMAERLIESFQRRAEDILKEAQRMKKEKK